MDVIAYIVRDAIPSYLKNVPIPRSFKGFLDLSSKYVRLENIFNDKK